MSLRPLDCLAAPDATGWPVHAVRPDGLAALKAGLPADHAALLDAAGYAAKAGEVLLLPGPAAVFGLGSDRSHLVFGDLTRVLPPGTWRLAPGDYDPAAAVLGHCLGAYDYARFRAPRGGRVLLVPHPGTQDAALAAETAWMVRDLINTPANALGPFELADSARAVAETCGATFERIEGIALDQGYPAIAAVGAAAARPPCVAILRWAGSGAGPDAPLVSLCGKGVVFDTGGLDLKPSAAMLRMKKDMGGAAILLGVARLVMRRDLPVRLELRLGCVENAVGGAAMRPGDILATRAGLSVEVGNTDAEGRLMLADLLADACDGRPALLIDCATLTGAARVATGPDLPALFCNDDALAAALIDAGTAHTDPLWRLPLWPGYDGWLASPVADLNNVSSKPFAGAIVAALFLQRFISGTPRWAHVDAYAWNDATRPARPEGGEAQAMRAIAAAIATISTPPTTAV